MPATPKVSVVMPVYNGAAYLAEALDSVLAQTYPHWDLVVLDNRSTDATAQIVEEYASRDPRVRLHRNETFLPIILNWNAAIGLVAPDSKYCKVLHADDTLEPSCLADMVAVGESDRSVGIIAGYVRSIKGLEGQGLPVDRNVFSGHEIARKVLLSEIYVFGNPSSVLIRNDVIAERGEAFYNDDFYHADFEVCLDILRSHKFGMVHAPVSFTRKHDSSQSNTFAARFNTNMIDELGMLEKHGRYFLSRADFTTRRKAKLKEYQHLFTRRYFRRRITDKVGAREYWNYHQERQERFGISFRRVDLIAGLFQEALVWMKMPRQSWRRFREQISARRLTI